MSDHCKDCETRGDYERCNRSRCYVHRSWFARRQATNISRLSRELAESREECERYKFERDQLRGLHDTGIKEAYRICGVEDDGEYRWKWVLLELATLKAEKEKADQIIKDLSSDRMLYKDMAERAEETKKFILSEYNKLKKKLQAVEAEG